MTSHWPTELDADGKAPVNVMLVASGDEHLMRQAMYQLQAGVQLKDRGFEIASFQQPLVGKMIRITIPIAVTSPEGKQAAIYTQSEDWTAGRIDELRTWIANFREESDIAVIVASRLPVPDAASAPEGAQWLHLPYDTLNKPDTPAPATTEAPLLPCLKEAKWQGRGDTVCRVLWEKASSPYMPWVAVGYDHPHTFEFINTKRLAELNTTEKALEAQALAALCTRPAKWQPVDVDVKGKTLTILTCSGDYFSAERILDAAFMRQAQQILKAPGLFVGVPRRGLLMATGGGNQDQELIGAFGVAVAGQFSRGESALISPMLFAMKDGAIVGILEEIAEAIVPDGEPKGAPGAPADEDDPNAPYVSAMVSRNDRGSEDVHLLAGGPDGDRLAKAIEAGFQSLMKEHAARAEFSGHIQVVVLGMTPPAARKQIPQLLEHLRGICSEMSRGQDRRYRVSLTYQKDSLSSAPETPAAATPAAAPRQPRARAAAPAPPPQANRSWLQRKRWSIAAGIAALVYFFLFGGPGSTSYPATLAYGGASLSQATTWERDRISAAVYVPPGETMPSASRQVGVIVSTEHREAASLLGWIQQQSQSGRSQRYHDAVRNNERCVAGLSEVPGGARPYLALQLCTAGASRAACIELDQAMDDGTLATCLNKTGCFADLCEQRWLEERAPLDRTLTSVLSAIERD